MIIVTRPGVTDAELDQIRERVETLGMRTHLSRGEQRTIIGCIGDESLLAEAALLSLPGVESVTPVTKPYKLASREFAADPTVVRVGERGGTAIGARRLAVIAGPCSVEGRDMLHATARAVRDAGEREEGGLGQQRFVADAADDGALLAARDVGAHPQRLHALADVVQLRVGDTRAGDDDHGVLPSRWWAAAGGRRKRAPDLLGSPALLVAC